MRPEIEFTPSRELEIALIDRFGQNIKVLREAVGDSVFSPNDNGNEISALSASPDGVHFSERDCPSHPYEGVFSHIERPAGEVLRVEKTDFEWVEDETQDITGRRKAEFVVENGVLIKACNRDLLRSAVDKLDLVRDIVEATSDEKEEAEDLFASALELMIDLTTKYDGLDLPINVEIEETGKIARGMSYIRNDNIVVWVDGEGQNEMFFDPNEGYFECVQVAYEGEKHMVLQKGRITQEGVDNPEYIKNCVSQLTELRESIQQIKQQKLHTEGIDHETAPIPSSIKFIEVPISQSKPF